jgi:hypothetical protein
MGSDRDAFTKISEALKHQTDRLIDLQFDLFALAAAMKNQVGTDQAAFEQNFRAVREDWFRALAYRRREPSERSL